MTAPSCSTSADVAGCKTGEITFPRENAISMLPDRLTHGRLGTQHMRQQTVGMATKTTTTTTTRVDREVHRRLLAMSRESGRQLMDVVRDVADAELAVDDGVT